MGRQEFDDMVYGPSQKRSRSREDRTEDDVSEIGKTAVKGVVAVAEIGVAGAVLGGMLGAMKK